MTVVGIDPSLTGTGVVRINTTTRATAVRRLSSKPTDDSIQARVTRLRTLASAVVGLCVGADLVVIEGPAYGSKTGHMHERSGYWFQICSRLVGLGIPVVEVAPNVLKTYVLGKGGGAGTDKDNVLAAVIKRYPRAEITGNDIADAMALAAMGARWRGVPVEESLPASHLRAMKAVKWPI